MELSIPQSRLGDTIELETQKATETYINDRITIVDPSDVSVPKPRERGSLTLVTCYPFYFVGSAPKRYIVQASVADPAQGGLPRIRSPKQEAYRTQTQDEPVFERIELKGTRFHGSES